MFTVPKLIPNLLAVGAASLVVVALLAMTADRLTVAGLCFLSASLVIYLRETRLQNGSPTE